MKDKKGSLRKKDSKKSEDKIKRVVSVPDHQTYEGNRLTTPDNPRTLESPVSEAELLTNDNDLKRRSGNLERIMDRFASPTPPQPSSASTKNRSHTFSMKHKRNGSDADSIKGENKGKIKQNLSHGNILGMGEHHKKEEKSHSMRRAASFKEVWDAMSHFHMPHSYSTPKFEEHEDGESTKENTKSHKRTKCKFLDLGPLEFNHFETIKQIGSGTFGRVYLCKHKTTGEAVVIKALEKRYIIKCKQQSHVMEEKQVLRLLGQHECPFTVQALGSFQDKRMLYFIMEYIAGGELFAHLDAARHHRFSEKRARYYVCELILALRYMHEKEHIVYRDIKPENMLLDKKGHLKIIDFGFAKQLYGEEKTYTFCGTPDYLAPEVIQGNGYNYEADLWSLGVFIYELVVGHAPFVTVNPHSKEVDYRAILAGEFSLPSHLSPAVKDLIIRLLQVDRRYRLGMKNGMSDVMKHLWFDSVDWDGILNKTVKPPKRHHFKKGLVNIQPAKTLGARPSEGLDEVDQSLFTHFDFNMETDSDISEENFNTEQGGKTELVNTRDDPKKPEDTTDNGEKPARASEKVSKVTTEQTNAQINNGTRTTIHFSIGPGNGSEEEDTDHSDHDQTKINNDDEEGDSKMFFI